MCIFTSLERAWDSCGQCQMHTYKYLYRWQNRDKYKTHSGRMLIWLLATRMCLCMYVCMYVYMYVCMQGCWFDFWQHVCASTNTCRHIHAFSLTYWQAFMYIYVVYVCLCCMYVYVHVTCAYACVSNMCICMRVRSVHVCAYAHVDIYMYYPNYMYICMVNVYVCMYVYIYIYINSKTHTCINSKTYIHVFCKQAYRDSLQRYPPRHTCVCIITHPSHEDMHTGVYMYVCMYVHTCIQGSLRHAYLIMQRG
jgi:hypothetical protein